MRGKYGKKSAGEGEAVQPSEAGAWCLFQEFTARGPMTFQAPQHYLLYAASGRLRLEADGRAWTLPPARAALVAAQTAIDVTLPGVVLANSVLFAPWFVAPPPEPLTVFEVTPLVRALLAECRAWTDPAQPLDDHGEAIMRALASTCWRLARTPSPASLPLGSSALVKAALRLSEAQLQAPPSFRDLARELGVTERSLARRFRAELGMTWRESLRRARMVRAIEHLSDAPEMSITDIGFGVGYQSLSAFNAAFRAFTGRTPTAYRRSLTPE